MNRNRRSGRGNPNGGRGHQPPRVPVASTFKGRCDELKGHVYELISPGAAAKAYSKTTDEVVEHIGKNCKIPEVKASLEQMTLMGPVMPADPATNAGASEMEIWKYKNKQNM